MKIHSFKWNINLSCEQKFKLHNFKTCKIQSSNPLHQANFSKSFPSGYQIFVHATHPFEKFWYTYTAYQIKPKEQPRKMEILTAIFIFPNPKLGKISLISGFLNNQTGIEEAFSVKNRKYSRMQKHSVEP